MDFLVLHGRPWNNRERNEYRERRERIVAHRAQQAVELGAPMAVLVPEGMSMEGGANADKALKEVKAGWRCAVLCYVGIGAVMMLEGMSLEGGANADKALKEVRDVRDVWDGQHGVLCCAAMMCCATLCCAVPGRKACFVTQPAVSVLALFSDALSCRRA